MKLATTIALLFVINLLTAQVMPQSITADSLMARLPCKTIDCINAFAINNHFFLKQKTNIGNGQNIYNSNETYKADSSNCALPDELSAIMSNTGVMEITYKTVVKSTHDDLISAFARKGFKVTFTEIEDDILFSTYTSPSAENYQVIVSANPRFLDGVACPYYSITINWEY